MSPGPQRGLRPASAPPRIKGQVGSSDAVLLRALRALVRAESEEEIVGIVIEAVRDMGAAVAPPTGRGPEELPIDVTFGTRDPLVPVGSRANLYSLGKVLPGLVEDAHVALDRARRQAHFADSASTDTLTGLPNRRTVMRVLARMREGDTVVMLDLDHFKAVNDTLGHDAGDSMLKAFAGAIREEVRASDIPGRLGGEEFVLLLPGTDLDGAMRVLGRLRSTWEQLRSQPVTFSAGVAAVTATPPRQALTRADEALYVAKSGGRDRFEVAP